MRSEWRRMTLRDAGVSLIDCEHKTPPASQDGYPYFAIPQLSDGRLDLTDVRRISHDHFLDWTKKLKPQANDVIVVRRCNSGDSAVVPAGLECAIGQNLVVLRADGRHIYPEFLRWLVRGPDWWEHVRKYLNVGAVFDSLKCRDIPNFELLIPPLSVQVDAAKILNTIDDRIVLLRETNATLESIARAIFKSWFIDYNPVRAKAEGRKPEGMDEETLVLFPNEYEESEFGPIPKGWRHVPVASLGKVVTGKTPPTSESLYYGMDIPFITIPDMHGKPFVLYAARYLSDMGAKSQANKTLPPLAVCVSCIATPGVVSLTAVPSQTNQQINSVVCGPDVSPFYLYLYMKGMEDHLITLGSGGSATLNVNKGEFEKIRVVLPPKDIMMVFAAAVTPLFDQILHNIRQVKILSEIRDLLLPALIKGKLRIPKAQVAVEEVLA